MTRICADTPAGRVCYDDRRGGHRYPHSSHGFGMDRGARARQKRQEYWDRQREELYYRDEPRRAPRHHRDDRYRTAPHFVPDDRYGRPDYGRAAPVVPDHTALRDDYFSDGVLALDELRNLLQRGAVTPEELNRLRTDAGDGFIGDEQGRLDGVFRGVPRLELEVKAGRTIDDVAQAAANIVKDYAAGRGR